MLIWIKDAPQFQIDSDKEVTTFIFPSHCKDSCNYHFHTGTWSMIWRWLPLVPFSAIVGPCLTETNGFQQIKYGRLHVTGQIWCGNKTDTLCIIQGWWRVKRMTRESENSTVTMILHTKPHILFAEQTDIIDSKMTPAKSVFFFNIFSNEYFTLWGFLSGKTKSSKMYTLTSSTSKVLSMCFTFKSTVSSTNTLIMRITVNNHGTKNTQSTISSSVNNLLWCVIRDKMTQSQQVTSFYSWKIFSLSNSDFTE